MAVADDAGPKLIRGKLLEEIILVARPKRVRAIAQVRAEPSPGADGIANQGGLGCCMPDRDHNAGRDDLFDKGQGAGHFGSQRQKAHSASGGILERTKLIPVRRAHVPQRMRSARAILGRNIRPFDVDAGQRSVKGGIFRAGVPYRRQAMQQVGTAGRHERWAEGADAMLAAGGDHLANVVGGQTAGIKAVAATAIDLQIEERGSQPGRFVIRGNALDRLDGFDDAVGINEIDDPACGIVTASNAFGLVRHHLNHTKSTPIAIIPMSAAATPATSFHSRSESPKVFRSALIGAGGSSADRHQFDIKVVADLHRSGPGDGDASPPMAP